MIFQRIAAGDLKHYISVNGHICHDTDKAPHPIKHGLSFSLYDEGIYISRNRSGYHNFPSNNHQGAVFFAFVIS